MLLTILFFQNSLACYVLAVEFIIEHGTLLFLLSTPKTLRLSV